MTSLNLSRSAGILAFFTLVSLFGLNFRLEAQNDAGSPRVHPRAAIPAQPPAREKVEDSTKPGDEVIVPFAVFTVTNTNDSGAGSLRAAVAAASPGDTIDFGGLTTPATITLTSGQIEITKNLIILGPGANLLTISGNNASRIFLINEGNDAANLTVSISGLTLTQGNGVGGTVPGGGSPLTQGGAIFCNESLTLTNCTVSGNTVAGAGGGAVLNIGASRITGCTFSGNTVSAAGSNGGALFISASGNTTVTNSTLSGNTTGNSGGAAIIQASATANFRNCTVVSNVANGANGGGGLRVTGTASSLNLQNTIIAGNTNSIGNDLTLSSGSLTGNNNVVGDAASSGGLTNGTNGNIVGNGGSGIRALNTIINTTLANNGGPTNTHAVAAGSVAINAGANTSATTLASDQRGIGFNRISSTTVDIGAVESGSTSPSFTGVTPLGAPAQITGVTTLSYTVPPGTNRLLVVTASNASNTAAASVSFGGTPMTLVVQRDDTFAYDSIFRLALGTSSTATSGNIVVTGFATAANTVLTAQTFENVNQTTPIDGTATNQATGANLGSSVTINTTTSGDLVFDIFDCFLGTNTISSTPGAGQAAVHKTALTIVTPGTGFAQYLTSAKPATSASTSTSWTSNTEAILHLAANINQATAGTTVSSINRVGGTSVCSGASVSWTVTFAASVSGLTTSNFALANTGLTSPSITGVSGSGTTWTVTASTGSGSGSLGLNMANSTGVTPTVTNLPFTGQVFTVNANPTAFNVTGGGSFCSGGTGVAIGLSGSQTSVNYQLFRGASPVGAPLAGTGSALNFGNQTTAGTYTVVATSTSTACTANMTGSAVVTVNPTPTAFSVTGGGSFCSGGTGVAVGLSDSETGVNYQLFNGASPVGSPVAGTGSAISFGNQTTAGTYTVTATNATTSCTANMTGSAVVTVNPAPTAFNVTGGGSLCSGGTGVPVGLSGSQTSVNYQLFRGASPVGAPLAGTGSALNFGNQTTAGTYTVVATATTGGCTSNMTGSAVVTVNPTPTTFSVTGGGSFCSGGTGVAVGLSGSETGVNYQLFNGASPVGSPVAGTGLALSFGNQTTAGTYTVVATNATTSCTANMTGSAVVTVNPTPTTFSVTGGGSFCSGGTGVAVGLSGSQTGVNYQLFNGASPVGSPVAGTGSALNFGNQTTAGTYTVVATNTSTGCTANMTGSAVVTVNANPTAFNVTGGGSFCSGGTGVAVGLSGSQTGVNYQLFNGASPVGSPVAGTGSALNFGNQTTAGTYTVVATATTGGCTSNMTGSAVVTVNPLPAIFNVTGGGGTSCVGGSGVAVGLSGSETGVNYQLFNGASPVGSPVAGTGSALSFGNQTTAGTYTVVATNATTGCTSNMTGNAVVTVVSAPTAFNVTGGGSFCSGSGGVAVGLSGSETGVNYQLFRGASAVGSPVAGTGSALSFGIQTTGGTYTVVGTNATAGCSTNMTGSAVVTVNPTPSIFNVTGGGSFCSGGTGVAVGLSGSETGVNYQLFNGASPVGSPVAGTGSALSFGNQTTAGTYTVVATNATTSCTANMTGSAVVTVNPAPTAFNVTGGGSFCSGGTGVAVGLSGSQTGVNYQLFNGASPVGSPVAGTGSALNFGNQTTAGTYTVVATNATTSCTANMTGSATVTVTNCAPTVTTSPATGVSTTGATLNGSVNANGDSTTVLFRYGTTAGGPYPNSIAATPSPVTGTTPTAITATVSGLTANQVYYFIAEGTNGSGTTQGNEQSFSTATCTFSLSAPSANFPASGGNGSVTLTTTAGCAWNVSGIPAWISNVSPANGTGTTAITFTVAPNQSETNRSATLTIGGQSYTVNQDAAVAINSSIGFSVVSQNVGPPSCSPTYANDYVLVVNVTNNSAQTIYTPYFQVVELQEAAGSPAPTNPFRLLTADGATCTTGGLIGSIQSTDGAASSPATLPTLAPGQTVTIRFVIGLERLQRFRFVVSGGGSAMPPVSGLNKGSKTNPLKFVSSATTQHSGGMAFLVVPSQDGKNFETIPVQPELESFLRLGDDFWVDLNRALFANKGNTHQTGSHR